MGDAPSNPRWYLVSPGHFYQGPCHSGKWQRQKTQSDSCPSLFPVSSFPCSHPSQALLGVLEQTDSPSPRQRNQQRLASASLLQPSALLVLTSFLGKPTSHGGNMPASSSQQILDQFGDSTEKESSPVPTLQPQSKGHWSPLDYLRSHDQP